MIVREPVAILRLTNRSCLNVSNHDLTVGISSELIEIPRNYYKRILRLTTVFWAKDHINKDCFTNRMSAFRGTSVVRRGMESGCPLWQLHYRNWAGDSDLINVTFHHNKMNDSIAIITSALLQHSIKKLQL